MRLSRIRIPFFRIFYSGTFTLFALVLAGLLLITPGDHIYQAFRAGELFRIIIVAGVYVLTFAIAVFLYAARLFSTRSALAKIPRELKLGGDVKDNPGIGLGMGKKMGRLVRESWERSAIIAYESTPRDLKGYGQFRHVPSAKRRRRIFRREGNNVSRESVAEPVWGLVHNAGWSGPESVDMPDLHFESVLVELGPIIEAKAVSLAPPDPSWEAIMEEDGRQKDTESERPPPDPAAVDLIRRLVSMGLREYIEHLSSIGILPTRTEASEFLDMYEEWRFGGRPLQEDEFRQLMSLFADILRHMQPADQSLIDGNRNGSAGTSLDDERTDDWAEVQREPTETIEIIVPTISSQSSVSSHSSRSDAAVTAYTAPSRARYSRNISTPSYASQSTDSVIHYEPEVAASMEGSQSSLDTGPSSSSDSSIAGSVVRTSIDQVSLDLPRADVEGLDGEDLRIARLNEHDV